MNTTQEPNTFVVYVVKVEWLNVNMENIEQGRPIEFIRHRRESGGYEKVTTTHDNYYGTGTYTSSAIKRVDNG